MSLTFTKKGDESTGSESASFDRLFLTYYKPLVAYTFRLVGNKQSAEDIVQTVFMSVWIKWEEIDFVYIQAYLYKAAYRKALDALAANKNRRDMAGLDIIESYLAQQDPGNTPSDDLSVKEIIQEISHFIDALPSQSKRVFKLSRESNFSNKEIAHLLQISEKGVEKHITKVLSGLKAYLQSRDLYLLILLQFV